MAICPSLSKPNHILIKDTFSCVWFLLERDGIWFLIGFTPFITHEAIPCAAAAGGGGGLVLCRVPVVVWHRWLTKHLQTFNLTHWWAPYRLHPSVPLLTSLRFHFHIKRPEELGGGAPLTVVAECVRAPSPSSTGQEDIKIGLPQGDRIGTGNLGGLKERSHYLSAPAIDNKDKGWTQHKHGVCLTQEETLTNWTEAYVCSQFALLMSCF